MKFIVVAVLLYFAYRLYIKPFLLNADNSERQRQLREEAERRRREDKDGYIDYEEVD